MRLKSRGLSAGPSAGFIDIVMKSLPPLSSCFQQKWSRRAGENGFRIVAVSQPTDKKFVLLIRKPSMQGFSCERGSKVYFGMHIALIGKQKTMKCFKEQRRSSP